MFLLFYSNYLALNHQIIKPAFSLAGEAAEVVGGDLRV